MLLTKFVEVKWHNSNRKSYQSKGYIFTKYGDTFLVKTEDLPTQSHVPVLVECDYCGKVVSKEYRDVTLEDNIQKHCCQSCSSLKIQESIALIYKGSPNTIDDKVNSQEFVVKAFEKYNLTLIDTYQRFDTPMKYICNTHPEKGIQKISFHQLQRTKKCNCKFEKVKIQKPRTKYTLEIVAKSFEEKNYLLLAEVYENTRTPLKYICNKHPDKIQYMAYSNLLSGRGCWYCGRENAAKNTIKYTYEDALREFDKRDLEILETKFEKSGEKMKYRCRKHPEYIQQIALSTLLQGVGCKYCGFERLSGENSYMWKGGVTPLLLHLRRTITPWQQDSMKACNYKCIISGQTFEEVHHIKNFSDIVKETLDWLRLPIYKEINKYSFDELKKIEETCLKLHYKYGFGICMTKELHREFHRIFGIKNNTKEQIEQFIKLKQESLRLGEVV